MIEIQQLSKTFKLSRQQKREMGKDFSGSHIEAVRGVSLTCQPGRVFTLLGPNGAGKTTILRIIATILKPTSGTVKVGGFDVARQSREVRRKLGFLTGDTGLYDRLTPLELVKYYADLNGMPAKTFEKRRDELFELLEVNEFARRRIGKLSTGMKQKVSLVRTMIHDPEILVFDEPTAGLDVITARSIIQLIRDCRAAGKTVLFSTHHMDEVRLLSDDLAVIHQGELCYLGKFENFAVTQETENLEDEFIRLVGEA